MINKRLRLLGVTTIVIATLSFGSVNAAIIDHGIYTTDTNTGLDWLDITQTTYMSYNTVKADASLSDWRHATHDEVTQFFNAFGGNGIYDGWSLDNDGLFALIAPLWGDIAHGYDPTRYPAPGDGSSQFVMAETYQSGTHNVFLFSEKHSLPNEQG